MSEAPDHNPKTRFGIQKTPLHLVPPEAIRQMAWAFALGAEKYGPYNWRDERVSSSVYYAAAKRHLDAWWDGEDLDPDTGKSHLGNAMACLAILVDAARNQSLNDDRPPALPPLSMQDAQSVPLFIDGDGKRSIQTLAESLNLMSERRDVLP